MSHPPIEPTRWTPPPPPRMEGPYARNTLLSGAALWATPRPRARGRRRPDARDRVVTGLVTGDILAFPSSARGGRAPRCSARHGGPPARHRSREPDGERLVICDANKGLLRLDASGRLETLVDSYEGVPLRFTNNAAIASSTGRSTSATRRPSTGSRPTSATFWSNCQPRGRLFAHDPRTRETRLVLGGLYFANGVALSRDETLCRRGRDGGATIWKRVWLKRPAALRRGRHAHREPCRASPTTCPPAARASSGSPCPRPATARSTSSSRDRCCGGWWPRFRRRSSPRRRATGSSWASTSRGRSSTTCKIRPVTSPTSRACGSTTGTLFVGSLEDSRRWG